MTPIERLIKTVKLCADTKDPKMFIQKALLSAIKLYESSAKEGCGTCTFGKRYWNDDPKEECADCSHFYRSRYVPE